jgi:hypothetical protein
MINMLLIIHHIALCTPCIALFICDHLLHIWVDHAESESEFQAEQVRWVFGCPQASCCEANIVVMKASPSAFNHAPCLLSSILLYVCMAS